MNRTTFALITVLTLAPAFSCNASDVFIQPKSSLANFPNFQPTSEQLCDSTKSILANLSEINTSMCSVPDGKPSEFSDLGARDGLKIAPACLQYCVILSDGTQGRCFTYCLPGFKG
jgi:hypothetical protein